MTTQSATIDKQIDPAHIMQVGMGFWASKTLLTAVNLKLFTLLSGRPQRTSEIQHTLELQGRGLYDFLDALVALGFLHRKDTGVEAQYANTPETDVFLDQTKPSYIGGMLEMANNRLYQFWGDLEEGLKTGDPQNEMKHTGKSLFDAVYSDPERLSEFLKAMRGVQMGPFIELARKFDFSSYETLCDIGGASGALAVQVAIQHPHMQCITADLPVVEPVAQEYIAGFDLQSRVTTSSLDFFEDQFPKADVITMGNILHDWGIDDKKLLIGKAYEALSSGGAFIVIENVIDNDRKSNVFGLLMSLNMLIETEAGFDFTEADFDQWARGCGFKSVVSLPLVGPTSALIAIK